jgi:hypothetical protein
MYIYIYIYAHTHTYTHIYIYIYTYWIGHILRRNCLLQRLIVGKIKDGIEVTEDEEEDVGSYWMTLRKGENTLL